MRTMAAGEFKAKCLAVMAEVNATGQPLIVTKRGKGLAWILPFDELTPAESPESIFGCLRNFLRPGESVGDLLEPIIPTEDWDHLKDDWSVVPPK